MPRRCCDIQAGDLRHQITIQAEGPTTDAGGGQTDPWSAPSTVVTTRAKIEPFSGSERWRAMQLESPVSHRISIRYRSGVTAKHRVKFGSRVFQIRSVINVEERNRFLDLICEEGVAT